MIFQWDALADTFVGELFLFVPTEKESSPTGFISAAHIRPINIVSLHNNDPVNKMFDRQYLKDCYEGTERLDLFFDVSGTNRWIQLVAVPIVFKGKTLGVLVAERLNQLSEYQSIFENLYSLIADYFFQMVIDGNFPYSASLDMKSGPRVGDGIICLNTNGIIEMATPNAISSLYRLGVEGEISGKHISEFGFDKNRIEKSLRTSEIIVDEIQSTDHGVSVIVLPLVKDGKSEKAIVLLNRTSDDVQQDRLDLTMDTTIREIHHRVKNNLQTVSSILQLQGRRVTSEQAKSSIGDSVRRIRSIAVVHELLSKRGVEEVALIDIVRPIVALTKSAFVVPDRPIIFDIQGQGPTMPETLVSGIGVIITELLQNSLIHGFPEGSKGGKITIELIYEGTVLTIRVSDDGASLPEGFDVQTTSGLGLTIVKTLVEGDLKGTLTMESSIHSASGTTTTVNADLANVV